MCEKRCATSCKLFLLVLMGMRHVEGAYYAVDVTTVWVHRDISVLCFADAVWNREHGYYEMRSHSE